MTLAESMVCLGVVAAWCAVVLRPAISEWWRDAA